MHKEIQEAIDHPIEFKTSYYFSQSWAIFGKAPWMFIGAMLVGGIISFVLTTLPYIGEILSSAFSTIFFAGFYIVSKKIKDGTSFEFNDFFGAFQQNFKLLLIIVLSYLFILIGFALLVLPGIYLLIAYSLSMPIALFYDEEVWTTLETSRKIVTKKWFSFFLFFILLILFNLAGAICLVIGLLVTIPVSVISVYVIFDDLLKPSQNSTYFQDIETLDSDI